MVATARHRMRRTLDDAIHCCRQGSAVVSSAAMRLCLTDSVLWIAIQSTCRLIDIYILLSSRFPHPINA
eukprot:scaffold28431_cov34-Prasinocladus_malaysianus.AAC.1